MKSGSCAKKMQSNKHGSRILVEPNLHFRSKWTWKHSLTLRYLGQLDTPVHQMTCNSKPVYNSTNHYTETDKRVQYGGKSGGSLPNLTFTSGSWVAVVVHDLRKSCINSESGTISFVVFIYEVYCREFPTTNCPLHFHTKLICSVEKLCLYTVSE